MASTDRARVFFALWPDDAVRDALAGAALRAVAECGGRATPAPKVHVTLFFVGEVDRAQLPELAACANGIAGTRFDLVLDALGYWRHNRIVWAGTGATPPALSALVAELTKALTAAGYRGESRPYVPHVTLVRNARRAPRENAIEAPVWRVREFALVESAAGGYERLAAWPLQG